MENTITSIISTYLDYCSHQKLLSPETIKAYKTDICQYHSFVKQYTYNEADFFRKTTLESYIKRLNMSYMPKSVKRKISSLKALFQYMYLNDIIHSDPWGKIHYNFKEAVVLPKTIPLNTIEELYMLLYTSQKKATSTTSLLRITRDTAVCELLFGTGIRISELCSIDTSDINFYLSANLNSGL